MLNDKRLVEHGKGVENFINFVLAYSTIIPL